MANPHEYLKKFPGTNRSDWYVAPGQAADGTSFIPDVPVVEQIEDDARHASFKQAQTAEYIDKERDQRPLER